MATPQTVSKVAAPALILPPSGPEPTQRLYGLERDVPTGCWAETYHDVPLSVVEASKVRTGDARHIPGVLMEIERDARGRVG
jgi:hypothetical protein